MTDTQFVSQADVWAEIEGIPGTWSAPGETSRTAEGTKVRDGGAPEAEEIMSLATRSDMTLTRPWSLTRDFAAWRELDAGVRKLRRTITVFFSDEDGIVIDKITHVGRLKSVTAPGGDALANAGAMLVCIWGINRSS